MLFTVMIQYAIYVTHRRVLQLTLVAQLTFVMKLDLPFERVVGGIFQIASFKK